MASSIVGSAEYQLGADLKPLRKDLALAGQQIKAHGRGIEQAYAVQGTNAAGKFGRAQGMLIKQSDTLKQGILAGVGLTGGVMAFSALAGAVSGAVNAAADFDDAMTKSLAIMGDVSDEMRTGMEQTALDVARTTTFSATQAAEAYFFLASAGLDAAQAVGAMPKVAQFAQAGNFDLATATDLLTDAQSALGLTVDDTAQNIENMVHVSDVLVEANNIANATVEQFSVSLTNKGAAALRLYGQTMEDGVAILAAWADQGVKGQEAGTRLDIVLRDLTTTARKNADVYDEFGIAVYDGNGNVRSAIDILSELDAALAGLSDREVSATLAALGFQQRSISATASLLGLTGKVREYRQAIGGAGGTTEEVAQKQLESFRAKLALLGGQMETFGIAVGDHMLVPLGELVEFLTEATPAVAQWFDVWTGAPDIGSTFDFFTTGGLEKVAPQIREMAEEFGVTEEKALELAKSLQYILVSTGEGMGTAGFLQALAIALGSVEDVERRAALAAFYLGDGLDKATGDVGEMTAALDLLNANLDDYADVRRLGKLNQEIARNRRLLHEAAREGNDAKWARAKADLAELRAEREKAHTRRQAFREWKAQRKAERKGNQDAVDELGEVTTAAETLDDVDPKITVKADTSDANAKLDALRAEILAIGGTVTSNVTIDPSTGRRLPGLGRGESRTRHTGGPVAADEWYRINTSEAYFRPGASGYILDPQKTQRLASTTNVHVNVNAGAYLGHPEDAQRMARQITPHLRRELDRLALRP